jgi:hypothetical protein
MLFDNGYSVIYSLKGGSVAWRNTKQNYNGNRESKPSGLFRLNKPNGPEQAEKRCKADAIDCYIKLLTL